MRSPPRGPIRRGDDVTMPGTAAETKSLVQRLEDAMNKRQLDQLDEVMAPDFVRHCEATPHVEVRSLEQFKEFLRQDAASFPDNVQTFTHIVAEDDMIGIFATYEGTHLGQMGPFAPTGKKAKFDFAGMFRVENGKLAEFWITWDNMTILGQLGLLPDPPS
jgi:predicted ester cyclase